VPLEFQKGFVLYSFVFDSFINTHSLTTTSKELIPAFGQFMGRSLCQRPPFGVLSVFVLVVFAALLLVVFLAASGTSLGRGRPFSKDLVLIRSSFAACHFAFFFAITLGHLSQGIGVFGAFPLTHDELGMTLDVLVFLSLEAFVLVLFHPSPGWFVRGGGTNHKVTGRVRGFTGVTVIITATLAATAAATIIAART